MILLSDSFYGDSSGFTVDGDAASSIQLSQFSHPARFK